MSASIGVQGEMASSPMPMDVPSHSLSNPEKDGLFKYPVLRDIFRKKVIATLQANPQEYKTQEDFVKYIAKVGDEVKVEVEKMKEGILADHLKGEQPIPAGGGTPPKKQEKETPKGDNITDRIADALTTASAEREGKK